MPEKSHLLGRQVSSRPAQAKLVKPYLKKKELKKKKSLGLWSSGIALV
jgi:hypothetical protein